MKYQKNTLRIAFAGVSLLLVAAVFLPQIGWANGSSHTPMSEETWVRTQEAIQKENLDPAICPAGLKCYQMCVTFANMTVPQDIFDCLP